MRLLDYLATTRWSCFKRTSPVGVGLFAMSMAWIVWSAWYLAGWKVDDAAISLTYARNLVVSGALVDQPGSTPVEGFSNPLWVLLLAVTHKCGFGIEATSWVSGILLIATALRISTFKRPGIELQPAFGVAALLVVMQPSVLIWSFSGLENALLLYAGVEILLGSYLAAYNKASNGNATVVGLAASVAALTRPEGLIYAVVYPAIICLSRHQRPIDRTPVLLAVALPLLSWTAYEIFRRLYFGEWVPNTYYAKGGMTVPRAVEILSMGPLVINRMRELADSIFGWVGAFWGVFFALLIARGAWRRGNATILLAPCTMALLATLAFIALPSDWMGELRFATLFYPAAYLFITISIQASPLPASSKATLLVALLAWSAWQSFDRICEFSENPTISVKEVEARSIQFEGWAAQLELGRASLLTADVGGLLWRGKLQIIDLGMLTDKTIALALGEGSPSLSVEAFHNYIFGVRKPDFIATRAYHSWIAKLDDDPRFRRDYVPLKEYTDLWILRRYGEERKSGDYVRRDLVMGSHEKLATLQKEASTLSYPFCKECPPYTQRPGS